MSWNPVPLPRPLIVERERLHDIEQGSRLEWLETDGRGGYAAGTATGTNTRRYHGLLVVARQPPSDRVVLLSRMDETLVLESGERVELATNFYPGTVHPQGYLRLQSFALDPWPMWLFRMGALELLKEVFISRAARCTVLRYQLRGGAAQLELRPMVAARNFHALASANHQIAAATESSERIVAYQPYEDVPPLVISFADGEWQDTGDWYFNALYPRDAERGLGDREDLFCPGVLRIQLEPVESTVIACSTRPARIGHAQGWVAEELQRRGDIAERGRGVVQANPVLADVSARLSLAADAFLVERGEARSIVAGYPWFGEWSRDAMIALPGICLARGLPDDAAAVLRTFAAVRRDGLLPNRFPDRGDTLSEDDYNAADAPLWFVEAVAALHGAGGAVDDLWPAVEDILHAYERGTRHGIRMGADGLITQGAEGLALTWMDARVDGRLITPRHGKAVDINALWYNALCRAASLAAGTTRGAWYGELAARCRSSFDRFWYQGGAYLYDVIDAGPDSHSDAALRPNQLLAVSLPHSPLDAEQARSVVDAVERTLLVPLGVRTLSPGDPSYVGAFDGPLPRLDSSYHQGPAWPWLLGPFAFAYLHVHGDTPAVRYALERLLEPVHHQLASYGLGHLPELMAGDPPHAPGGCFAQAWSCAELLRVIHRLSR